MKVNINGRGIIPGIGTVPPVFGKDLSEGEIRRLLNFPNLKVYDAASGSLITKRNINSFFMNTTTESTATPVVEVPVTPSDEKIQVEEIVEEAVVEVVEDVVVAEAVDEVVEEVECDTLSEAETTETEAAPERVEHNNNQHQYNGKKHKHNRH